jgi:PadR family transcriptional regulator
MSIAPRSEADLRDVAVCRRRRRLHQLPSAGFPVAFPLECWQTGLVWESKMSNGKTDVWQGTLALMVLKVLEGLGPQHGFGIARRIEQTSGDRLILNPGTLYPTLLKLEQEGAIKSAWGVSDNNRRARFYRLTRAGRARIERETRDWQTTTDILAKFLALEEPR